MSESLEVDGASPSRDELVARLQLMEAMVIEGRHATGRFGWVFVLWGLVDLTGMAWQIMRPHFAGVWPIVVGTGIVLQAVGQRLLCRPGSSAIKARAISAVWQMMGVTMILYCFTAAFAHHAWGETYVAAILMILGLAHGTSALILRWWAQGIVSVLWLASGVACYFVSEVGMLRLFVFDMVVGMVLFGLYAMLLERRRAEGVVSLA